jgi:hypothetical protein
MGKPKVYDSRTWLRERYVLQGKSIVEMAKEAKVAPLTIRRALEREGFIRK